MATIQQKFEQYLIANHKEEFEKFISEQIELAKSKTYYAAESSPVPYDSSLCLYWTEETIGARCKEDFLVLCAYTGEQRPTFMSGHGLDSVTVGDEIEEELSRKIDDIAYQFVADNYDEVYKELLDETDLDESFFEEGLSAEELAECAICEYGILITMFCCMETFPFQKGLLDTLSRRYDLYNDWREYNELYNE